MKSSNTHNYTIVVTQLVFTEFNVNLAYLNHDLCLAERKHLDKGSMEIKLCLADRNLTYVVTHLKRGKTP